ncbi:MAG: CHASE3 domain-containing protein, partial [Stenotrophomonas sp.]
MALVFSDDLWDRWRLPALALAAVAIIVVPWLTLRKIADDNVQAMQWVSHTQDVGVAVYQLQADVRDVESAALTMSKGLDAPGLRERLGQAKDIPQRLARLAELTRDNPDQLIRIGRIQSMVERRMELARQLARASPDIDQREMVQDLTTRYPIRGLIEELQATEEALLRERSVTFQKQQRQSEMVSWSALLVQLSLLGLVLWLLHRQMRHRATAERASLRSAARAASVLNTVREPIVLLDRELKVQLHNPAFAELYGLDEAQAVDGLRLDDIGAGAWRDAVVRQRLTDVLLRGRELWDYEHEQRTADEQVRTMLINARRMPLPDKD